MGKPVMLHSGPHGRTLLTVCHPSAHGVSPLSPAQAAAGYTGAINTPEWRARPAFLQSFEARVLLPAAACAPFAAAA